MPLPSVSFWPPHRFLALRLTLLTSSGSVRIPTLQHQLAFPHIDACTYPHYSHSPRRGFFLVVPETIAPISGHCREHTRSHVPVHSRSVRRSKVWVLSAHVDLPLQSNPCRIVNPEARAIPRAFSSDTCPVGGTDEGQLSTSAMTTDEDTRADLTAGNAIDFLRLVHNLKTSKRTGWVQKGVRDPESIADHMYRMSTMAIIAGGAGGVDQNRCVKMAIVHDLAEAIVGDITPHDGVSKEKKHKLEADAMTEICQKLGSGDAAREVWSLWEEYEANESKEAKLVKDFDKVEMVLQAFEYEKSQGMNLEEFFESTKGKFQTRTGKAWAAEVIRRREVEVNKKSDVNQQTNQT